MQHQIMNRTAVSLSLHTRKERSVLYWKQVVNYCLAVFLLACVSCASTSFSKLDTKQPGWQIRQGEVTWKPSKRHAEVLGEFVLAFDGRGESCIEFSKAMLPIVTTQISTTNWQIQFNSKSLSFKGTGVPSERFGWLQLPGALEHNKLPNKWKYMEKIDGTWKLENRKSGEVIEGRFNQDSPSVK